jgi:hypothetical protein
MLKIKKKTGPNPTTKTRSGHYLFEKITRQVVWHRGLRRVFDLSEYFNEATAEEITTFASHEKLDVANIAEFVAGASAPVRKKIALIRQSGILEKFTTEQIVAAAQNFNVVINTSQEGKITLPSNGTELRRLLRFLDEDYYKSPLSETHYISNSKRVAD